MQAGQTPREPASRELPGEPGLLADVVDLGYPHSIPMGELVPPRLADESAFFVRVPSDAAIQLGPEHDLFEWVSFSEAMSRLPFKGLREAVRRSVASRD